MREYLIRRTDGEWFDLHVASYPQALRPTSFAWRRVEGWGDFRIEVLGVEVSFSQEDPGIQVSFEGILADDQCDQIVDEIRRNVERATGQHARIVAL